MARLTTVTCGEILICGLTLATVLLTFSCASTEISRPIVPIREYEKMLVRSLFADHVGNETCLKACHSHDRTAAFLAGSVHGQRKVEGTEMPLVNCETCHGPGSEAIDPEFLSKHGQCDTTKFIPILTLPTRTG